MAPGELVNHPEPALPRAALTAAHRQATSLTQPVRHAQEASLCAAVEAMSADGGDMHIRVIWVLPGGGQQCTSAAGARISCLTVRVPVHRWACPLVLWGGNHRPAAAGAWQCCGVVAGS
jgi:hypothetical protein